MPRIKSAKKIGAKDATLSIRSIYKKFPRLKSKRVPSLNREIFHHVKLFVSDPNVLAVSLLQDPLSVGVETDYVRKQCGRKAYSAAQQLNRFQWCDALLLGERYARSPAGILYLVTLYFLFKRRKKYLQVEQMLSKKHVAYALKLLEYNDVSEIHQELEDIFFEFLNPKTYAHYVHLLKFTKRTLRGREKEVAKEFTQRLRETGMRAEIHSRVKTIYSIHKKIIKKKILYSQVLDAVGLRFIVRDVQECYRALSTVLRHNSVVNTKIKDFIAVPKPNGYQSIHLTVIYNGYPVEIQIRTKEMHRQAQYGTASHSVYKKG